MHFIDRIFFILFQNLLSLVSDIKSALIQVMAWHQSCSKPMMSPVHSGKYAAPGLYAELNLVPEENDSDVKNIILNYILWIMFTKIALKCIPWATVSECLSLTAFLNHQGSYELCN